MAETEEKDKEGFYKENPEDKESEFAPDAEELYREAGVEGNDQNAAIRNNGETGTEGTLGNAETSERGQAEFETDHGIPSGELTEAQAGRISTNTNKKHPERGKAEFEKDEDLLDDKDI